MVDSEIKEGILPEQVFKLRQDTFPSKRAYNVEKLLSCNWVQVQYCLHRCTFSTN